jgi:hypothetical protein
VRYDAGPVSMWYSIEVFDGAGPASGWASMWTDALCGSALASGATDWSWHAHSWGVVFEVAFPDEAAWEAFRELPAVGAALDSVPDPVAGLIVYRGRAGSAGSVERRPPKPLIGSGSAALPLPWDPVSDWPIDLAGPSARRPLLVGLCG